MAGCFGVTAAVRRLCRPAEFAPDETESPLKAKAPLSRGSVVWSLLPPRRAEPHGPSAPASRPPALALAVSVALDAMRVEMAPRIAAALHVSPALLLDGDSEQGELLPQGDLVAHAPEAHGVVGHRP
jgi:hypothetical protein